MSRTSATGRWRINMVVPIGPNVSWETFRGLQPSIIRAVELVGGECRNRTTNKRNENGMALEFEFSTPIHGDWDQTTTMAWAVQTLRAGVHGYSNRMDTALFPNHKEIEEAFSGGGLNSAFWNRLTINELPERTTKTADEALMDERDGE